MNSTMNSTQSLRTRLDLIQLVETYHQLSIILGILLAVLSVITTFGNGLLLLAIWRDPFKSFRTPTTFFIIGLAAADFLTGLTACPMYAWYSISSSLAYKNRDFFYISNLKKIAQIGQHISMVTMNSSFIILLLFTWSQFTAISFPHKHRAFLTKKRVQTSVILTWAYSGMFSLFSKINAWHRTFLKIDLYFNTTGSLILLTVAYFCLFRAFRQQMRRLHSWRPTNSTHGQQRRGRVSRERQFIVVNLLLLSFIIACTMPVTVISYLAQHWVIKTPSVQMVKLGIAMLFANGILFLKFAIDPLVYAWRLSQYRRALKSILFCSRQRTEVDEFLSYSINNRTAISIRRLELNKEETNAIDGNWPA